jgi:lysine-N-methylase
MSIPVRSLPVLQNWECHSCTDCCRIETLVSDEEKERIEKRDLAGDAEIAPGPWFERRGEGPAPWALKHRADGSCVFLTAGKRCRLQERFGAEAKPFVCRLFPFLLIPAGDHWRVGLHFSCPSATENSGPPLSERASELNSLAPLLEKHVGRSGDSAPPPLLQAGQQLSWPDVLRIVQALIEIVQDRGSPLELRLRQCLALARVARQARLENLHGGKLSEFLKVVRAAVDTEVPRDPANLSPPGWIGRVLFRSTLAIYARRDLGIFQGPATRSRLGRLRAGWRFVRGRGAVPRVNSMLPETTFEEVASRAALPADVDASLERYYLTKLHSLQFFGPPNFDLPFWAGLDSLVLTLPMILWLARALTAHAPVQAVHQAMVLVDQHFGSNALLGSRLIGFFLRTLSERGELAKLVAWYSRRTPHGNASG